MGKNKDGLRASRDTRAEIQMKYGFVPTSIIVAEKWKQALDPEAEGRSYGSTEWRDEEGNPSPDFRLSGYGARGGALSRYPQNIGAYLVKMYSNEGDTILDPFAGHNSRMELVWRLNRNYIGYDCSATFSEANRKIREQLVTATLQTMFPIKATIELHEADARDIDLSHKVDVVLTSPPYWDIEYYGDEAEQLGRTNRYADFLYSLEAIISRCVKCLRQGGYCCISVNDFRRDGVFYPYHADLIYIYRKLGLILHDIVIVDLGVPISAAFASQLDEQKRTAKRHEYVVVGRKR